MLDSISFENFKAFKKIDNLSIKPITVLCGANSCGKSTVIKNLLLMKQTLESSSNKNLLFNGKYVRMGDYKSLIFNKDTKADIRLQYNIDMKKAIEDVNNRRLLERVLGRRLRNCVNDGFIISYDITFCWNEKNENMKINPIKIKSYKIKINDEKDNDISSIEISECVDREDRYNIIYSNFAHRF